MIPPRRQPLSGVFLVLLALLARCISSAGLIPMDYCATINTGTTTGNRSDYQSDGLCSGFCRDKTQALAIVKGNFCWCSNYVPSSAAQVPIDRCRDPCPGYTEDTCGGSGTWGYMLLAVAPSGTTMMTSASPTSTSGTSGGRPTPSVSTVTAGGEVRTVTVMPSESADSGSAASSGSSGFTESHQGGGSSGLSSGAAAGIAVGVVAIFVIGGIIGFIVLRRRRMRQKENMFDGAATPGGSSRGMTQTPASAGAGSNSRIAKGAGAQWGSDDSGTRRSSFLMPSDPRMNGAHGIYTRPDNKSHDSFLSIQDNRDYSRPVHEPKKVLRVTNADPDDGPS